MTPFGEKPKKDRLTLSHLSMGKKVLGGLFCIIVICAFSFFVIVQCSRKPFVMPDTTGWQTGDIFFSAGNSWRSVIVKWFDTDNPEGLTHCGFVVIENGQPMLIHMSTDKNCIAKESVREYGKINDVSAITVRRLKTLPDTLRLRKNIELLLNNNKLFDNNFNHNNSEEYYCTEFVVRELQNVGIHVFDKLLHNEYIYPVDLASSTAVTRIKNQPN